MESPRLDDRSFAQLVAEATRIIERSCPTWTDRSHGDPGIVLLEAFAHLTEVLIYRVNRLPEKAFIEFLRLMGTRLHPPAAARVTLRFARKKERSGDSPALEIPRNTRVTIANAPGSPAGADAPVFATVAAAVLTSGTDEVAVPALHCELVDRELMPRRGSGMPGQWVRVRRPPIIGSTGDPDDLVVEVEAQPEETVAEAVRALHDGKVWRRWREVESFTNLGADRFVFVADRMTGTITFAPSLREEGTDGRLREDAPMLADVPGKDREIRVSYRRGGGASGNVVKGSLTVIKSSLPAALEVTNPEAATGGRAAESLQNALVRGPQELHSLRRAVTARDFELVALRSGAVARAKAFARASLWTHAPHGEVEVLLVPYIPEQDRPAGRVTAADLAARQTEAARAAILATLVEQIPLGTRCRVNWARYKTAAVKASIAVRQDAVPETVRAEAMRRLHEALSPLPSKGNPTGWEFGRPLRDSLVIGILLSVPGVLDVHGVEIVLEHAPDTGVTALAPDHHQEATFYATSGAGLFRTLDDADGFELCHQFAGERANLVLAHPERAGLVAVTTQKSADAASVYVSRDCGETWPAELAIGIVARIDDVTWSLDREGTPLLWLATDKGLFKSKIVPGEMTPVPVAVDPGDQTLGFRAAVAFKAQGRSCLAVAAAGGQGVFLSDSGGDDRSFRFLGPRDKLVSTLAVQTLGPRVFLWAGLEALHEGEDGEGCLRVEILPGSDSPEGWRPRRRGWKAGTCYALAFQGEGVLAASYRGGVLWCDGSGDDPAWDASELTCGLPIHEERRALDKIETLAAAPAGGLVIAGGPHGIHRAAGYPTKRIFREASSRAFEREPVTIPSTWLFCSGQHELAVDRRA